MNYYNEHDPKAAAWLRELISRGLIPAGEVDERSIEDVTPSELADFTQCHFFAGIGGWSLALQYAGWPPSKPIWTGSCPCQPFSQAGQGKGIADERHLWPAFKWLIEQRRPPVVIGEQVASKDGREWLAGVRADLEDLGYDVGAADLCAAGIAAPHIRQRLYWVADAGYRERGRSGEQQSRAENTPKRHEGTVDAQRCREAGWMGHTERKQHERRGGAGDVGCPPDQKQGETRQRERGRDADSGSGANDHGLVLAYSDGCQPGSVTTEATRYGDSVITAGFWSDYRLVHCRDGKTRRIASEPALFPLVDGLSYQLARRRSIIAPLTRGPGNAIVSQLAAEFIAAYCQA